VLTHPSPSEVRSWERSLATVARDTTEVGLGVCDVLIEHLLPRSLTWNRAAPAFPAVRARSGGALSRDSLREPRRPHEFDSQLTAKLVPARVPGFAFANEISANLVARRHKNMPVAK
jgi:hypothetical protein